MALQTVDFSDLDPNNLRSFKLKDVVNPDVANALSTAAVVAPSSPLPLSLAPDGESKDVGRIDDVAASLHPRRSTGSAHVHHDEMSPLSASGVGLSSRDARVAVDEPPCIDTEVLVR
jgi:hypothetical protein